MLEGAWVVVREQRGREMIRRHGYTGTGSTAAWFEMGMHTSCKSIWCSFGKLLYQAK